MRPIKVKHQLSNRKRDDAGMAETLTMFEITDLIII